VDATANLRNLTKTMVLLQNRGVNVGDVALRIEKANRISQALWEGVTDELRAARGGPTANVLRQRINRFRVEAFGKTTDPMLNRGLDIHSVFDNAMKPKRYAQGARFDPEVGDLVGGPSPLAVDDALAQAGEMAPMYYPLMDAAQLPKRGDFLRKSANATYAVADQNLKKNTGRLLSEARFSKDAKKVWRIRAAQTARMQEHMDLIFDTVAEYGRPLKPGEILGPNEEYFAPGLVKKMASQHNAMLDSLADDPTGRGLKDLLDKLSGDNAREMKELLDSNGDIEAFAVPKVVAERMRRHSSMKLGEGVDITFGTPTKLWKATVLAGRPAWMVNNLFSNVIFLKLQGGKMADVLRQFDKRFVGDLREAIGEDALSRVEGGLYSSSKTAPRAYNTETVLGKTADVMQRRVAQSAVGNKVSRYSDWIQGVNSGMEDAFRRASYMTAAERNISRANVAKTAKRFWQSKDRLERSFLAGLDEKSWKSSVDEMNHYLNDYNTMSPLERNIIRPYIMPFMAFYKHAAKLLLTMPFDHPAKTRLFSLIQEADQERMKQEGLDPENLPGWLMSDSLFLGRGAGGDARFMSGGGLNPFNAVMDSPLNTLHPVWKMLYEQSTGRSAFTGKQFTDPNVVTNFGSDQQYRINPKTGEAEPIEKVAPGLMEHLLQQIPQYESLKDIIAGGRTYDTTSLLNAASEGPVLDSEGKVLRPTSALEQLARLFGYSPTSLDTQSMEQRTLEQRTLAVKAWLARQAQATPTATTTTSSGSGWTLGG
jgi:hypothetical protein